jgi:SEC-C motif-containing protein
MRLMSTPESACPCGHTQPYASCCGRFHAGPERLLAPTAEALMRSRYSAYVMRHDAYLTDTWHPSTRPTSPPEQEPGLRWLGLQVLRHHLVDETHAEVEFVARSKLEGRAHRLRETSRFVREGGVWFYVDGDVS